MNMKEVAVTELDGTRRVFISEAEVCRFYGLTHSSLKRRLRGEAKCETRKFELTGRVNNGEPHNKGTGRPEEGKTEKPFNPLGFPEIPYETIGTRVCITPCPYNKSVKIASVRCQCCYSYHGHSRERHLVACNWKSK